jgi:orotate phosphoribosyltransferase
MDVKLVEMLKETGAVKFGDFTLSSGRKSKYYVDKYIFETNPKCLDAIGERIAGMIPPGSVRLAGIEIGSIPLAAIASVRSGIPFVIVRKEKKGYGTNKLVEGVFNMGEKVLVIEDVVTTAKGAIGAISSLREAGLVVDTVICVVDREEGGRENLEKEGIKVVPLVRSSELLGYKP